MSKLSSENLQQAFNVVYLGKRKTNVAKKPRGPLSNIRLAICKDCGLIMSFKKTRHHFMANLVCTKCGGSNFRKHKV